MYVCADKFNFVFGTILLIHLLHWNCSTVLLYYHPHPTLKNHRITTLLVDFSFSIPTAQLFSNPKWALNLISYSWDGKSELVEWCRLQNWIWLSFHHPTPLFAPCDQLSFEWLITCEILWAYTHHIHIFPLHPPGHHYASGRYIWRVVRGQFAPTD